MVHEREDRRVSRRRLITGIGTIGLGGLLTAGDPSFGVTLTDDPATAFDPDTHAKADALFAKARTCRLAPSTVQGPYYFETGAIRSDLREDREGVRLRLAIKVQDGSSCRPLPRAVVEIWHCDAAGLYSGAESESRDALKDRGKDGKAKISPDTKFADLRPTDRKRYLRGVQIADAGGVVRFTTIWPGWYPGRTVHIHAMVVVDDRRALCTELMFAESLNRRVLAQAPYLGHDQARDTFNGNDPVFKDDMLAHVVQDGDGYLAVIVVATDPDLRQV
ncbi:protocatechuate dioxygenase [Nonomuraea maheshkhaliensis]|uniref:Protocatechuate dioxygenase n=1 Tax=Nonomuraea maheshkhaliensis TaxID=419590 RepID=A0ABN2F114_9ACTN